MKAAWGIAMDSKFVAFSRHWLQPQNVRGFCASFPKIAARPAMPHHSPIMPNPGPIFISHSSKDRVFADRLVDELEARGLACWYSPRDIPPGADWPEELVKGVHEAGALALLLSKDANASPHVHKEVRLAAKRGIRIFPIHLDRSPTSDGIGYDIDRFNKIQAHQYEPPTAPCVVAEMIAKALNFAPLPDAPGHQPRPPLLAHPARPSSARPSRIPYYRLLAILLALGGVALVVRPYFPRPSGAVVPSPSSPPGPATTTAQPDAQPSPISNPPAASVVIESTSTGKPAGDEVVDAQMIATDIFPPGTLFTLLLPVRARLSDPNVRGILDVELKVPKTMVFSPEIRTKLSPLSGPNDSVFQGTVSTRIDTSDSPAPETHSVHASKWWFPLGQGPEGCSIAAGGVHVFEIEVFQHESRRLLYRGMLHARLP